MFNTNYYFDNSATTQTRKEVRKVMDKYFQRRYANPSSTHKMGMIAKGSIEMARETIASVLNSNANQLVFTGSGSESNNAAIHAAIESHPCKRHIISSRMEHSSVYNTMRHFEEKGYQITYLPVDSEGRYNLQALENAITDQTFLITLAYANNEVGTIQDVYKITAIAKKYGVLTHLDGVQALPYEVIDLTNLKADFVSFSGHKLYAPKGIGLLYIKNPENFSAFIKGGGQEYDLRSGTENVPYILGLSKAIQLNHKEKSKNNMKLKYLRDQIHTFVLSTFEDVIATGDINNKVPSIASFTFKNLNAKSLVRRLSTYNIAVSSGSACSSSDQSASRILKEMGYSDEYLKGNLRLSLGKYNTAKQLNYLYKKLKKVISEEKNGSITHSKSHYISQEAFALLSKTDENIQILDVRIASITKLPFENLFIIPLWKLKNNTKALNPNKETILICNDGDLIGPEAQSILQKKGFTNVKILSGGSKAFLKKTED